MWWDEINYNLMRLFQPLQKKLQQSSPVSSAGNICIQTEILCKRSFKEPWGDYLPFSSNSEVHVSLFHINQFPQVIVLIGHIYHDIMVTGLGLFCWFLIFVRELSLKGVKEMIFREGNRCEDTWLSGLLNKGNSRERYERMSHIKSRMHKLWNICSIISRCSQQTQNSFSW